MAQQADKPVVKGPVDGNVFAVIGAVSKTLKRAGQPDAAQEFRQKAFASHSYGAVLTLAQEYVEFDL